MYFFKQCRIRRHAKKRNRRTEVDEIRGEKVNKFAYGFYIFFESINLFLKQMKCASFPTMAGKGSSARRVDATYPSLKFALAWCL